MNLADLQREAHAIAKEHGWWDEERTFGDLIALVHSELSEALEAYREGEHVQPMKEESPQYGLDDPVHGKYKPVGVPSELADVVIRVADMAEWYGVNLNDAVETFGKDVDLMEGSFGDWVTIAHLLLCKVAQLGYVELDQPLDLFAAGGFVKHVQYMAAHYGIDLDAAIEAKMEHNRTRSYRHGGKAL